MGNIDIDIPKTFRQAEELEQIAEQIRQLAYQKLNAAMEGLAGNWTGENAEKFYQKGRNIQEKLLKTANRIDQTARNVRSKAASAQAVENAVRDIANRRTYGK